MKGPQFIALHKLFDEINEEVEDYVDLLAERVVQLGGIAEGTVGVVAKRTSLIDYPLARHDRRRARGGALGRAGGVRAQAPGSASRR